MGVQEELDLTVPTLRVRDFDPMGLNLKVKKSKDEHRKLKIESRKSAIANKRSGYQRINKN